MRKINLSPKPSELTAAKEEELKREYNDDRTSVWRKSYIVDKLLEMTFSKCAYSETILQRNSSYMEVDHFFPKEKYPQKVVEWGNLVACCKTCNTTKGKTDPQIVELINPYEDNPLKHISFRGGLCIALDKKGENSKKKYGLNSQHFVKSRESQITKNKEELGRLAEEWNEGIELDNQMRRFKARLKTILQSAQPQEPYSVCVAIALLHDNNFRRIKEGLDNKSQWTLSLDSLYNHLLK